jgi:hypothetical protein
MEHDPRTCTESDATESESDAVSEASDSGAGVAAGKKPRGAVLKAFDCPDCGSRIELTQLRTQEVQCGECGEWVSHNWPENHGKVQKEVKRLRELHFSSTPPTGQPTRRACKPIRRPSAMPSAPS